MMIKIIILMNLLLAINLIMMKSPLSSNLTILMQSIMITLMMNLMNKTSWISFMLFLLYIGGLMIIFLYISSIAFNELNINKNYKMLSIKMFMITNLFYWINPNFIMEMFNFENNLMFEDNPFIINMFMTPNNLLIYFIMMILFFILILIIWMLKNKKGPMRQKI